MNGPINILDSILIILYVVTIFVLFCFTFMSVTREIFVLKTPNDTNAHFCFMDVNINNLDTILSILYFLWWI